jgi:hypothetical protein
VILQPAFTPALHWIMVAYALLVGSATVLAITIAALVMYRVELVKQAKKLVCQSFLETLKKSIGESCVHAPHPLLRTLYLPLSTLVVGPTRQPRIE